MIKKLIAGVIAAAGLAGQADAAAYTFSFTNGANVYASGGLTTSDTLNGDNAYDILSISGAVDGVAITGLYTGPQTPFSYVNELRTQQSDPLLGLLGFGVVSGGVGYNLYEAQTTGFGGTPANPDGIYNGATRANRIGVFALSAAVPEPATWAIMLVGFGGLGAMLRRRRGQVALTV